ISFEKYFIELKNNFTRLELEYYQSNIEGEIINKLHEIGFSYDCILLNAGGYTHTSVAITDAIASISTDVIEVHMTNIYSREEFRKTSLLSVNCKSVICGFGLESYNLALASLKL
ncbi:MAG: 3-dehydroquinate dehydratase, partial [Flavobacteriales bacterium]|nr:3-dehydroquinate dehydratase [Flavobacteriales bacterium]